MSTIGDQLIKIKGLFPLFGLLFPSTKTAIFNHVNFCCAKLMTLLNLISSFKKYPSWAQRLDIPVLIQSLKQATLSMVSTWMEDSCSNVA